MSGSTHMAVGVAITVTIAQPKDLKESIIAVISGIIGGIIADVDTENATMARIIRSILGLFVFIIILLYKFKDYIDLNFLEQLKDWVLQGLGTDKLLYCLLFFGLLLIGSFTKHRKVTHSIEFIACQSIVMYLINATLALPFALAALSHTALDLLNHKKVKISLLLQKNISFGLCKANGLIDRLCFLAAMMYIFVKAAL